MDFDLPKYLKDLSNYELLESYFLVRDALISDLSIYMTILFAYITVAYFVAAKLTKFQAVGLSALYSIFALYMISSAYNSSRMLSTIGYVISDLDSSWEPVVIATILVISWIFSIVLFIQARRSIRTKDLGEA